MPLLPISHRPQRQQAECLAACAAMVLEYLNIQLSYDELIKELQIGPAGAPFRNLYLLQPFGVSVLIEQGQIDTLHAYLQQNLPPIVFVATKELSYWIEATTRLSLSILTIIRFMSTIPVLLMPQRLFPFLSLNWRGSRWMNFLRLFR